MASSPLKKPLDVLVACAHAIQDRNLELADLLLRQIWDLATHMTDEYESRIVKYYAEGLVRRAYGLHPPFPDFYFQHPLKRLYRNNYLGRIEDDALIGKKRLHIIDFYMPHLYGDGYLFWEVAKVLDERVPEVRVSVILPPFLKKRVHVQQEQRYLAGQAKDTGLEWREFKVIYGNSLGEVDDDELDLRRTEDEGVVIIYNRKLHKLVGKAGALERELLKLRQINPDIVFVTEINANHNDSNFIKRLEHSFPYYLKRQIKLVNDYMRRRVIGNIVGCEGSERVVRHLTLAHWRSLFLTAGFLPLPLETVFLGKRDENGCVVFYERNDYPVYFISAWKRNTESYNNNNNNLEGLINSISPLSEDIVHPIPVLEKGVWLNHFAAFAEIFDMLEVVCCKYNLPLALTWVGVANQIDSNLCKKHALSLSLENSYKKPANLNVPENESFHSQRYMDACARKQHLVEGEGIAGKALQSDEPFLFEPNIVKPDYPYITKPTHYSDYPFTTAAFEFGSRAAIAVCLQNQYNSDDVYVVEFFFPKSKEKLAEKKDLEGCIVHSFKNMNKKFVRLRVQKKEAVSNINPHMTMPGTSEIPALYSSGVFNQQGVVISNSKVVDLSTLSFPSVPSLFDQLTSSSLDGTIPISNQQIWLQEQENENHTSLGLIGNNENENEAAKADHHAYKLLNSNAKRRKLSSNVWDEFYKENDMDKDGKVKLWAICSHCNKKFDGSSKKGTTHLRNHLNRCKSRATKVMSDQEMILPGRGSEKQCVGREGDSSFDQDKSHTNVARIVIKYQLPLNIVEDELWLNIVNPMCKFQSQEALSSDILCVYNEEKSRLIEYFGKLFCRLNLAIKLWIDDHARITYSCFVVQFVDDNWVLKKKVIALKNLGHENEFEPSIFLETIKSLLVDWNFDKKICSLTIHNDASSSLEIDEEIRRNWSSFEASYPSSTFYISCDGCIDDLLAKNNTLSACLLDIHDAYKKQSQGERREYPLMNVKSDNNWRTCSMVLTISAILDPRFKFHLVEFSYNTIYGNDSARIQLTMIRNALTDIFNEYARNNYGGTSLLEDTNSLASLNTEENSKESFQKWYNSKRNSELDKYLEEALISSEMDKFEVLGWWREHASEFPILGRMARDILAIPMSTIISGFSLNEEVAMELDNPIFKGLDPQIIEAMICGRDWLESTKTKPNMTENNSCPIVELKDSPRLAHYPALDHFSSKYDYNEAPSLADEDLGSKAKAWPEKDVRIYLVFPIEKEEFESVLKEYAISGEPIGPDNISREALAPLLMNPLSDVSLAHARNHYIGDTVVNQFFILLKRRYEKFPHKYLKHHSFDSFMATFLIEGSKTESDVLSWVKLEDLKGVRKLFLPMCLNEHWLLFCADIDNKRLLWLDSKQQSRMSYEAEKQVILHWFLRFLLPSLGYDQSNGWLFEIRTDIPEQKNSVDCGLFVMKYADCLTHGDHFPFTQDDMYHFRHRIFLDLCRGRIH